MRLRLSRSDAWLLLMAVVWGSNFSVIKKALAEIPPLGFNLLRLLLASAALLAVMPFFARRRGSLESPATATGAAIRGLDRRDWIQLFALAVVGHTIYQLAFMLGIARTSVANTSLIFGCTPIAVAFMSAALGHERASALRWGGAALSAFGIYLVIGHASHVTADSLRGDLWVTVAMLCWATYTVGSTPLLRRHAPVTVTAVSMTIGTILYVPFGMGDLVALDWQRVHALAWAGLVASSLLALVVAYLIWYTAVQHLGSTRTAVYSNLTPIVAMTVAAIWLHEPLTALKIAGACAVIGGVAVTKLDPGATTQPPMET